MEPTKATGRFSAERKNMKVKTKWLLQRFAEETESQQTEPGAPQGENAQQGEQENGKKYSDEDLNRIISKKFAEWASKKDKEMDEATRLANMNAQERAEHERDELQKQLDELRRRDTLAQMAAEARGMLQKEAVAVPDSVIDMLVSTDADKTKKAVSGFAAAFKAAVQAAVVEQLGGKPPKTGGAKTMTKADILAVKNRAERQKLILEHQELFN